MNFLRLLSKTTRNTNDDGTAEVTTSTTSNITSADDDFFNTPEEEHEFDAFSSVIINVTIICCLLLAYYVKKYKVYYLPESAGAILIGVVIGGLARLTTDNLQLFKFSPELFFFVLLPPIIFEAGYSLKRKDFFHNIGAITLYAMVGTMISTFVVGGLTFYVAKIGLVSNIDTENPMEALLFGSLISAVDPVATLSIMGSSELNCDPLLYSIVFGESVLNDAIAISLFKAFLKYYEAGVIDSEGVGDATIPLNHANIPRALLSFCIVSILSVLVGVAMGLLTSYMYKHTRLSDYPNLETSLLFSFCYLCYSFAEALELSGIMALFFNGIVLSHYNSYNLSSTAHVASEQIFATVATITETVVFLYMGMGVFTGRFTNYSIVFSLLALCFCLLGRLLNIFPLSFIANLARDNSEKIPLKMQCVLWFAGLRGAIAFALSTNMPGPNTDVYATATLFICIFTTVVCGGYTEKMLSLFGMKSKPDHDTDDIEKDNKYDSISFDPSGRIPNAGGISPQRVHKTTQRAVIYKGFKRVWKTFDDEVLKEYFGGSDTHRYGRNVCPPDLSTRGTYELANMELANSDCSDD